MAQAESLNHQISMTENNRFTMNYGENFTYYGVVFIL